MGKRADLHQLANGNLSKIQNEPRTQVLELEMAVTEVREEADLLRLRLHIARAERDAGSAVADDSAAQPAALPPPRLCAQVRTLVAIKPQLHSFQQHVCATCLPPSTTEIPFVQLAST